MRQASQPRGATHSLRPPALANFGVPERRKIELIPFQTKQAAEAASADLKSGKDFLDVAKAAGFKQPDLDLGLVSKKEFGEKFAANETMIDAAFALEKGKISEPVDGPLSTVIMRVLETIPGKEKSFDEVKDQIRDEIVKTRSAADTAKLIKSFEDERTAGVQLPDIAKKLNLPLEEVTFDRTGKDSSGKPVTLSAVPAPGLAAAVTEVNARLQATIDAERRSEKEEARARNNRFE